MQNNKTTRCLKRIDPKISALQFWHYPKLQNNKSGVSQMYRCKYLSIKAWVLPTNTK